VSLTLLVENNQKIESFYMLNLSTWLGLQLVTKKRADQGIRLLESGKLPFTLIIVRTRIEKEESAKEIIEYVKRKELKIPVIVIGSGDPPEGSFTHVPNSLQLKLLIQAAAKALEITAKEMMNKVVPDYFPIPIAYFLVLRRSVCDVYTRDKTNIKIFNIRIEKLVEFNVDIINKMIKEGVDYLYVDKMDRLDFVNNVTSELITQLQSEDLSADEQLSAADKSVELLSKKLMTIGLNDETIELAKKNIENIKSNAQKHPKLSKLLSRLLNNKTSYLYQHTQILTYISLHIIRNIDWGTPEQEDKISFITFFHDIVLETDDQCRINSNAELKASPLLPAEKQLIEKHAQMSADFVTNFPHAPMGADQIVRQHHGTLNGIGFSEFYGANISPMAIVFIIAEEFTRIIMKAPEGELNRNELIKELREDFPTHRFQKIIDLLESITF
jgi:HD-GYP domain-containing protein (c-di-GMP phosphodiesterase class II)